MLDNFIEANATSPAGSVMRSQSWGKADSFPPAVDKKVCSISIREDFVMTNSSDPFEAAEKYINTASSNLTEKQMELLLGQGGGAVNLSRT